MGTAYLVLGPERTGTRLVTRLLIRGGCVGDASHAQPFDRGIVPGHPALVWRRSFPHDGQWPDVTDLVRRVEVARYTAFAVVTVRERLAAVRAQVKARLVPDERAGDAHLLSAYKRIFAGLARLGVPFIVVPYEALVLHPDAAQRALLARLGLLETGEAEPIYDGNAKHYGR